MCRNQGVITASPPALNLLRIEAALPAVLGTLGLAEGRRLQHGVELVLRAPALRIVALVGEQTARLPSLLAPVVQRRRGDAFFLGHLRHRAVMRRKQLLEDGFSALVGVLHRNLVTPDMVQSLTAAEVPTSVTVGDHSRSCSGGRPRGRFRYGAASF